MMVSLVLVIVDTAIGGNPIQKFFLSTLNDGDFDEVILRWAGLILFAAAMESDVRALSSHWGVVAILTVLGTLISVAFVMASTVLGLFIAFGFWKEASTLNILTSVLFGAIISPTDAHDLCSRHFATCAPKSTSSIIVGEGLT